MPTTDSDVVVRRAALPRVMFVEDVALALSVEPAAARRAIVAGWCGPYLRLGRRLAVLRDSFLAELQSRAMEPKPAEDQRRIRPVRAIATPTRRPESQEATL